ncbi:unnamed protein product [Porites lobata]|uniref:asparaginase n=1 Tax=Porites lobata TaxID=104759 RepID=A0ABN8N551_9CNID|nr:unnamed protein product [Porites lobata]
MEVSGTKCLRESRVLVLYTGGTIGMKKIDGAYHPKTGFLQSQIKRLPMLYDDEFMNERSTCEASDNCSLEELAMPISTHGVRVFYYIKEYCPIKDSSNMTISDWIEIALDIKNNYDSYDGFVVIHGTDTMAYSVSALSFMLENLGKSVVFTGSQVPIYEQRNDGRDNLLGALVIAGHYIIPEVSLYFAGCLYRGNRSTKVSAGSFDAFDSPNLPPLVTMKVKIEVQWDAIFRSNNSKKFTVHTNMNPNIGLLRLFPGITAETVHAFLKSPMMGVVLQTYGTGNAPNNRDDLITEIKKATKRGVIIINCTQCLHGPVVDQYATGKILLDAGVIPGSDMTPEAALTKLSYVLGKTDLSLNQKQELIRNNIRGELTVAHTKEQFSLKDNSFIEAVASSLKISSSKEMEFVRQALLPVLMSCAASSGNVETLEELVNQGADVNASTNYDGRTPLHIACMEGNTEAVKFLLEHGASTQVKDRFKSSPLDDAIKFRHKEIVKILRKAGAHLMKTSIETAVELCRLAAKNRVEDLHMWQLANVDFNCCDYDKRTPLHVAVCRNNVETVAFLLEHRVDPYLRDVFGNTPLDNANCYELENIVNMLEEFSADKQSRDLSVS